MTFPVIVHPIDGGFAASLVGAPDVSATAASREAAIAELEISIEKRISRGELMSIAVAGAAPSTFAGSYRTDPFLEDICDDAYRQRDGENLE